MGRKPLTRKRIADTVRWYDEGESIRAIAKRLHRSYTNVHELLKNEGVVFRHRGTTIGGRSKAMTTAERAAARTRAAQLRVEGHTIEAVAAAIGHSAYITRQLLTEAGMPKQKRTIITDRPATRAEVKTRRLAGESVKTIAVALGLAYTTVLRLLREAHAPRQPQSTPAASEPSRREAPHAAGLTQRPARPQRTEKHAPAPGQGRTATR